MMVEALKRRNEEKEEIISVRIQRQMPRVQQNPEFHNALFALDGAAWTYHGTKREFHPDINSATRISSAGRRLDELGINSPGTLPRRFQRAIEDV